jgi:hypothetical protein
MRDFLPHVFRRNIAGPRHQIKHRMKPFRSEANIRSHHFPHDPDLFKKFCALDHLVFDPRTIVLTAFLMSSRSFVGVLGLWVLLLLPVLCGAKFTKYFANVEYNQAPLPVGWTCQPLSGIFKLINEYVQPFTNIKELLGH